jgi:hypothetical protein
MGVEYRHFLVTNDDQWFPTKDTIPSVVAVLQKWGLYHSELEMYNLFDGVKSLVGDPDSTPEFGRILCWNDIEGEVVEKAMGKSGYDSLTPEDRYLKRINLLVGTDIRVQSGNQELNFAIIKLPWENGNYIESYCEYDKYFHMYDHAYRTSMNAVPPQVEISGRLQTIKDTSFKGYWRGAIVFDCGKDLPEFAYYPPYVMSNQELVQDLSEAFGTPLAEIGEVY